MRIRSTKPEFWRSKRIAAVDWEARLVLKALESYVDDNGVGKDDLEAIVGDLFSRDVIRDSSRTLARVSEAISALHVAGLLWRYEADGDELLYVSFWEQIQRIDKPQPGRFRRPDGTLNYKESEIGESFANGRESSRTVAPGTGEQGNRGTGEEDTCASAVAERESAPTDSLADDFEEWYEAYPRKRGRGQALKAYRAARRKVDAETLLVAIEQQAPSLVARGAEFAPYPATWLNGERWADQPDSLLPAPVVPMTGRNAERAAMHDRQMERAIERERQMGLR